MKPEELNKLKEAAQCAGILWSTLEAIHDASLREEAVIDTYREAIYGTFYKNLQSS